MGTQWTAAKHRHVSGDRAQDKCIGKSVHGTAIFYQPGKGLLDTHRFAIAIIAQRDIDGSGRQSALIPATIDVK